VSHTIIRYLRDHEAYKAGTEISLPVEDGQKLIDAGIAEYARDSYYSPESIQARQDAAATELAAALREEMLRIVRAERAATSSRPPEGSRTLYGRAEIVAELNKRTGTAVSLSHGMRHLRRLGARFERSGHPGARIALRLSEFDRLSLPPPGAKDA
jgi:hypothetical protein